VQSLIMTWPKPGDTLDLRFDSEAEARQYLYCQRGESYKLVQKFGKQYLRVSYPGLDVELKFDRPTLAFWASASPDEIKTDFQLYFADKTLPLTVRQVAADMMDSDGRWGIVRVCNNRGFLDQRQVVMSSGMSGVLLAGVDIAETTSWKRPQFWLPADLVDFNRDWQRQLDIKGGRELEYNYQIRPPRTNDSYRRYTSRFRLLEGEDGIMYHLGVFVGKD
jgi:hypothetical protein